MDGSRLRHAGAPVAVLYDGGGALRFLYGSALYRPGLWGGAAIRGAEAAGFGLTGYLFTPPGSGAGEAVLLVPPFCLERHGQHFVQPAELRIEIGSLQPAVYRVLAVQDFWTEDENPDLSECLATVFLGRRRSDGRWEEPENWPVECRTLAELGRLDARGAAWKVEWEHADQHR
jgi:hypothetical protein